MERKTGIRGEACGLGSLAAGQVAELRVRETSANYWTYIRGAENNAATVWLPEMNGEPVRIPDGAQVELSVTLSGSEILVTAGRVAGSGADGKAYLELALDAACARLEHKRRYLRVAAVVPAKLRRMPDGLTPWGEAVGARTTSLSPGGLSLEAEAPFAQGEQVAVELELQGCRAEATAVVLETTGVAGKTAGLNVRFTYISDSSEAAITRVIYQYQRLHGAARD
jgi:c-di-GMP-binding flagellar brake protein YcgR